MKYFKFILGTILLFPFNIFMFYIPLLFLSRQVIFVCVTEEGAMRFVPRKDGSFYTWMKSQRIAGLNWGQFQVIRDRTLTRTIIHEEEHMNQVMKYQTLFFITYGMDWLYNLCSYYIKKRKGTLSPEEDSALFYAYYNVMWEKLARLAEGGK